MPAARGLMKDAGDVEIGAVGGGVVNVEIQGSGDVRGRIDVGSLEPAEADRVLAARRQTDAGQRPSTATSTSGLFSASTRIPR